MKRWTICLVLLCFALVSCSAARQRGMAGDTYVSTARPVFAARAASLPLLTSGFGFARLSATGVMGGLNVDTWLAIYGKDPGKGPFAVVAMAELDPLWFWNSALYHPFAVDWRPEVIDGMGFESCTYMVSERRDPFLALMDPEAQAAAEKGEVPPRRWVARVFAARSDFNQVKIVLEYREPLPQGVTTLDALPYGQANVLAEFEQRAREAFRLGGSVPAASIRNSMANGVRWQYLDEKILGTVTMRDVTTFD